MNPPPSDRNCAKTPPKHPQRTLFARPKVIFYRFYVISDHFEHILKNHFFSKFSTSASPDQHRPPPQAPVQSTTAPNETTAKRPKLHQKSTKTPKRTLFTRPKVIFYRFYVISDHFQHILKNRFFFKIFDLRQLPAQTIICLDTGATGLKATAP